MGKVVKQKEGRIYEVEFSDGKSISLRFEADGIHLFQTGLFGSDVRKIAVKANDLYDDVVFDLQRSRTFAQAVLAMNNLYQKGQRRTIHEKDVAEHEELSTAMVNYNLTRTPLKKWEYFQQNAEMIYAAEPQRYVLEPNPLRAAVQEALEAYTDPAHPDHAKVIEYLLKLRISDPLRHPEDGLWILRDMNARAAGFLPQPADALSEFRTWIRGLKVSLAVRYYDPVPYLNDIDAAQDWLDAAEKAMARKDWQAAAGFCSRALDCAPNYLEAYYRTAECWILQNNYEAALQALDSVNRMPLCEKVFKHRPDYYSVYFGLCLKMPDKARAGTHLDRLKELALRYDMKVPGLAV